MPKKHIIVEENKLYYQSWYYRPHYTTSYRCQPALISTA